MLPSLFLLSLYPAVALALSAIQVRVERSVPGVSAAQVRDAWLDYHWRRGGGLPLVVDEIDLETRVLWPVAMKEQLTVIDDNHLEYRVTDLGWLLSNELLVDSHRATVSFEDKGDATLMIWTVDCEAQHRRDVWQAVTQLNIATVADNLVASLGPLTVYTRTARLDTKLTDQELTQQWLDFVWRQGGGLSVPIWNMNDRRRMVIPPFLVERVTEERPKMIRYIVENPGLATYQVYSHQGSVRFEDGAMIWQVKIRPWRGWGPIVKAFTSALVTTICRNFKSHVEEPNAMVPLKPPRGKGQSFGAIRKDSWLGGVLDAHLRDARSTWEQSLAMIQPWTWGRATDAPGEGATWTTNT